MRMRGVEGLAKSECLANQTLRLCQRIAQWHLTRSNMMFPRVLVLVLALLPPPLRLLLPTPVALTRDPRLSP